MSYFAPYIDSSGIHMPTYEDRLNDLLSAYQSIFGQDATLAPSMPDYQLLSVLAKALDDTSALVLQAYNSRNPIYASGNALDLLLPLYGVTRESGEDDATVRKKISAGLASKGAGSQEAIEAAVKNCRWVRDAKVYVNEMDSTDARGIPAHSIATVIYAGDGPAVAKAIFDKKAPGIGTYGNASETITDSYGNSHTVYYSRNATARVYVYMTIRRLLGCDEQIVTNTIVPAVTEYINNLKIGESLVIPRLYAVAYNANPELSQTFAVNDVYANLQGETSYTRDEIACAWNAKISTLVSGGVTLTFRD